MGCDTLKFLNVFRLKQYSFKSLLPIDISKQELGNERWECSCRVRPDAPSKWSLGFFINLNCMRRLAVPNLRVFDKIEPTKHNNFIITDTPLLEYSRYCDLAPIEQESLYQPSLLKLVLL